MTFDLLRDLLPGPVTTVFERSSQLNAQLNPGTALVGIRVPDHPIAKQLAACCGHPLALTSANVSDAGNTVAVEVSRGEERLRQHCSSVACVSHHSSAVVVTPTDMYIISSHSMS